jgi:hypothetical protein
MQKYRWKISWHKPFKWNWKHGGHCQWVNLFLFIYANFLPSIPYRYPFERCQNLKSSWPFLSTGRALSRLWTKNYFLDSDLAQLCVIFNSGSGSGLFYKHVYFKPNFTFIFASRSSCITRKISFQQNELIKIQNISEHFIWWKNSRIWRKVFLYLYSRHIAP